MPFHSECFEQFFGIREGQPLIWSVNHAHICSIGLRSGFRAGDGRNQTRDAHVGQNGGCRRALSC
jgi:hypothetical protein